MLDTIKQVMALAGHEFTPEGLLITTLCCFNQSDNVKNARKIGGVVSKAFAFAEGTLIHGLIDALVVSDEQLVVVLEQFYKACSEFKPKFLRRMVTYDDISEEEKEYARRLYEDVLMVKT